VHARDRGRRLCRVFAADDFRRFIADMAHFRMPVRFLRELDAGSYVIASTTGTSRVMPWINTMFLDEVDLAAVARLRIAPGSQTQHVETLYHEATHAWLDLKSDLPEVTALRAHGIPHYRDAPMDRGAEADPERLFEEAMGEYVGRRVRTYWEAYFTMLKWRETMDRRHGGGEVFSEMLARMLSEVPWQYDSSMRKRDYGYQPPSLLSGRYGGPPEQTTREMTSAMCSFADRVLLENKVPHLFVQSQMLMTLWNGLDESRHHDAAGW
jgi:hypothetical protein